MAAAVDGVVFVFVSQGNSPASVHRGPVHPDPGPLPPPVCHTHPGGRGEAGEEGLHRHTPAVTQAGGLDRNVASIVDTEVSTAIRSTLLLQFLLKTFLR